MRARTSDKISAVGVGFNLRKELSADLWAKWPFLHGSDRIPVIRDGTEQTYVFRADSHFMGDLWEGPWRQFGVEFWAREPASVDILSVSIIPKEARYASAAVGLRTEVRDEAYRRTLFTHTPAKLEYRVQVPPAGRLDVGLGVLRENEPITFRVAARPDGQEAEYLLDESYADADHWAQRSLDLAQFAGRTVTLSLETEAESVGTVALWAAPTLSGKRATEKPNIVFYIIDGAGADYMSAYGYNRRTTPNIERLAAEGALFEHAYSNSSWTRPSTLSFLTGLQHSALGGMQNGRNAPPPEVPTISEHLHQAGYQTALFTSNANAANMSGLDRGVDVLREKEAELSESTIELHADFWNWRTQYPGEPYWVHFQTTDVHGPHLPPSPFAGLYVSPERLKTIQDWRRQLRAVADYRVVPWSKDFDKAGVDRVAYFNTMRDIYAETMAHQDYQLGRLVERLKAQGEWENTLLIIASDHGPAGASADFAVATLESLPPLWGFGPLSMRTGPILRPGVARIPLIFVWPGHIKPGFPFSRLFR